TLSVDGFSFTLTGSATISPLTYRYTLPGASPVSVSPGGAIPLPSVTAGGNSSALFQILNPSLASSGVSAVSLNGASFSLGSLPSFPATIPAGGSLDVNVTFRPTAPGASTGTLTAGTHAFSLSGTGLTSGVNLTGLTDVVTPAQQPRVGVGL